ncbi:TIGR02281 family clan AA aspartic protease [Methylobacterium sp. J-076]|uniref:retropepsin-like aspartic protease family protein n=1 Tax=Methylobacterium sp. J-076 TaxID=2836655 RepID=UPI001FBB20D1|nr:TIGR02281 family clan AA aspartic protease [Methylobacterium sp. J-076]MCJ2014592.1 TIGR02281 family clan AA aspartic protease [Methylobacterium sp. J-076]
MIYLGLGALALVLVALALADGGDGAGGAMSPDMLANLAWTGTILALVVAGFWRQFRAAPLRHVQALAAWGLIAAALVLGYSYRDRMKEVSARVLGDLRPGSAVPGPDGSVSFVRRSDGTFRVEGRVGGRSQNFLFDTGASSVVLTAENAAALGFTPRPDEFNARVSTANGATSAAPIQLDSLAVGTITERNVNAMVARPGALGENLLGQTFLDRLGRYEVRGDRLIMTPAR